MAENPRLDETFLFENTDGVQKELRDLVRVLELRLSAIEAGPVKTFEDQLTEIKNRGIAAINEALAPFYEDLSEVATLGGIFLAASVSTVEMGLGPKSFVIPPAARDRFAPCAFMCATVSDDSTKTLMGSVMSYDRPSGVLAINVMVVAGGPASGVETHSAWTIYPSPPPMVPVQVDEGTFDGTAPSVAYVPFIAVSP